MLSALRTIVTVNVRRCFVTRRLISTYNESEPQYKDLNESSPVMSWNEWDPLEEIIVGRPDNGVIQSDHVEVLSCTKPGRFEFLTKNHGKRWADVYGAERWDRAVAEVEGLVDVLKAEGITVQRPDIMDFSATYKTPHFESKGHYAAMPRDFLLVVGDELIEAPMLWKCRYFEFMCYRTLIMDYWRRGAKWTAAPKPQCTDELIVQDYETCEDAKKEIFAESGRFVTTEFEPCWDAADFIRCGRDIFGQRSQVTNRSGIEWLRRHLAPKGIRVHTLTFDDARPMHVDATFQIPKPGVVLENPVRTCHQIDIFKKAGWKVVEVPYTTAQYEDDLWAQTIWLPMNTLIIDPQRVIVEKDSKEIQEMYRSIGMTPIPVPFRYAFPMGGAFHCWTSDIRRRGTLQSYF